MSDEYDAFGRKKDDSGLGDLGWGTSADPSAAPNPAPAPAAPATPNAPTPAPPVFQTPPQPLPRGIVRARRNPVVLLIQLGVLAIVGFVVYTTVIAGNDASKQVKKAINGFGGFNVDTGTTNGGGSGGGSSKVPKQVHAQSFFTASGLRAGLKILKKEAPGKVTNLSFRRDRIDLQVSRGGKSRDYELQAGGEVPQLFSTTPAINGPDSFTYSEINSGGAARLMRAANARLHQSESDVDYFVAQKFAGTMQWGIYYKGGSPIAQGDSHGRYTRRIS
jgi:hypothetical protein